VVVWQLLVDEVLASFGSWRGLIYACKSIYQRRTHQRNQTEEQGYAKGFVVESFPECSAGAVDVYLVLED
jgi:hypothetical protein